MAGHNRCGASVLALVLGAGVLTQVLDAPAVARPVDARAGAPLEIRSVKVSPGSVIAGGTTRVKVKLRNNRSTSSRPARVLVRLVGNAPVLAQVKVPSIPPTSGRAVAVDVKVPSGTTSGKRTLRVCVAKGSRDVCSAEQADAALIVLAPAALTVTPSSFGFGTTSAGTASMPRTFVVRNTGGVATGTLASTLGGTGSTEFATWVDLCTGVSLAAGASCAVSVAFTPTSKGAKAASLTVTGSPGGSATASLSGTGANPAALTISPQQHAFGTRATGTVGGAQSFTVTNTGEVPSGTLSAGLANGDQDQFETSDDTCDGASLAAGASCSVTVSFAPTTTGSKVASLQVSASPGGSVHALLSGTGAAPAALSVSPDQHAFGGISTGTSVAKAFTVTNTGGVPTGALAAVITGTEADQFGATDNTCAGVTLSPGASCAVTVSFAPTTTGAKSASLQVSGTPGGTATASLSGTGQTPPPLTFSPATWDFGAVAVFDSRSKAFTVTNTSGGNVGPVSIWFASGPNANQFSVSADTCTGITLVPGASCTFNGNFVPNKTGAMSTGLRAATSAGDAGTATLVGTGANPAQLYLEQPSAFGTVPVGSSVNRVLTLTNIGGAASGPVSVSQSNVSGEFTLSENTCSGQQLVGGASCSVLLTYTPAGPGGDSTNVTFQATPGGTQTVVLNATGGG